MPTKLHYVYIAGPLTPSGHYSKNGAIDYLYNVSAMVKMGLALAKKGYAPFCPGIDFAYFLVGGAENRLTEAMIKRMSKDWLLKCDCIVLCPGWEKSPGTDVEREMAANMGIPIFHNIEELEAY